MLHDYFAAVDVEGVVRRQLARQIPNDGAAMPNDEFTYYRIDAPIDWSAQPTSTSVLMWYGGAAAWVETAPIEQHRATAIDAIDAAGEALRLAVINRMPTQTEEYRQALTQAQAWQAAGYPETEESPAPVDVTSWAMARWRDGWTARQAADDILATAAAWAAILSKIRLLRLLNKQDVLHASTPEEVAAIRADMDADMQAMAQGLGLSLT